MQPEYTRAYDQLNEAQRQAVDTIDGPVLVVAGPGTGKTHLLALRTANILLKTDAAPQNILCLTYTEVGARNLRERMKRTIGQAGYDVRISTYHGFGSDIFRSFGEYFDEYSNQQPVDRLGQDSILQEIFTTVPVSNPLWKSEVYLKDTLEFIMEAKNALLSPDNVRAIADSNENFLNLASELSSDILSSVVRMDKTVRPHFERLLLALQPFMSTQVLPGTIQPIANLAATALHQALESTATTGKTNDLTAWKNVWLAKNDKNQWVFSGQRDTAKLRGAADIYESYNAALSSANLYDFSDMIQRAIRALETHDELRFTLHEQYQYIMLDEFQDTNLAQLKLVELLTNNPNDHGRPNVLAVGDDDQAIFSFQGADVTNMVRYTQLYQDVTLITLTDNYRSHQDILHTASNVADQIEDRLTAVIGAGKKQLQAKSNLSNARIERVHYKSEVAQYDQVAAEISQLIKQGTALNDIAIIAPQHRYLEPLVPYLTSLDIPIRYDKRENVFDDPHISELLRMARLVMALAAGKDEQADAMWPAVLSSEYWGLATSTIWKLSWEARQNYQKHDGTHHWQATMMDSPELKPIALYFARLATLVEAETLETMLDYLVGVLPVTLGEPALSSFTSPYYEYHFGKAAQLTTAQTFTDTLSNLTVLRQHLREYRRSAEAPLQLQDLLVFVDDYQRAGEKLLNTSPYHASQNAVQLLTAYGAKGLEFDSVFVLAGIDEVWGMSARGRHSNITLPANLQIIRRAGSSKDERKRLFYVALTRAKQHLFIASYDQNYAGKSTTSLEFLQETDEISGILPAKHQHIRHNDDEVVAQDALQHFWTTRHAPYGVKQPELRELLLPHVTDFQLSATHLNTFTNIAYNGPDQFFMNSILRFPKAPTPAGQYGSAVHETLEYVQITVRRTHKVPTSKQLQTVFSEKLRQKRMSNTDYERQLARGIAALDAFMSKWGHNFIPEALPEQDFKHEGAFVGHAHLSGKLDQLLVDSEAKAVKVIDFKTGSSHSRWTRDITMHKYRQQLLFYKLLVEHSHTYGSFSVEEGSLVFVEPDDEGAINELPITYTQDDIDHVSRLISAVWQRIITLDFPDTSQFSKDLKGVQAFETWLIDNTPIPSN